MMDYFDLKGVVENLVDALHIEKARFEACEHSSFFPGRTACLKVGRRVVGTLGELHPLVAKAYELTDQPILVAELDLESLVAGYTDLHPVSSISNFPATFQISPSS
jgi:phenylalanyl-tRNA synthetase beta chain